ncbi:hypothetical protein [Natrinema sp. 1APR25-10V2]|uniref:hypothetical protein n=1 Tax=Natrinema sp. 1APR25-10V2 TaxID=2951081 RepID=UPI002876BF19|nr:hypothetical protein [Natrinema sp. 1APR25-10V2]MDS0474675.1 hypothetical protein [Natrinema sp. 1APR25-10V2]
MVTNTGASPAAVFAGSGMGSSVGELLGEPHVSRLTPTLSGEAELEGWVTSSSIMATDYNSSRSNKPRTRSSDGDSDGDGVADADEEVERVLAYLGGNAVVAERFTVCLPDAEAPSGNGSIAEVVTPKRFIDYMTGKSDAGGRVYSWGTSKAASDGSGDCDDEDDDLFPGAVCGTSPHLMADITGPTGTSGRLEVLRSGDGSVLVVNSPPETDGGSATTCAAMVSDDPCGPGVWARTTEGSSMSGGFVVAQVLVQPPECPHPFPALLFVTRGRSDDQLVYTGGWIIDDAALYEDSVTVLLTSDVPQVIGVDVGDLDLDGDGLGDGIARSLSKEQGSQVVSGSVDTLVKTGLLSEGQKESVDSFRRKKPGGRSADGHGGGRIVVTHVALDAPILHLVNADQVSNEVKFKAGAELSKAVN